MNRGRIKSTSVVQGRRETAIDVKGDRTKMSPKHKRGTGKEKGKEGSSLVLLQRLGNDNENWGKERKQSPSSGAKTRRRTSPALVHKGKKGTLATPGENFPKGAPGLPLLLSFNNHNPVTVES